MVSLGGNKTEMNPAEQKFIQAKNFTFEMAQKTVMGHVMGLVFSQMVSFMIDLSVF